MINHRDRCGKENGKWILQGALKSRGEVCWLVNDLAQLQDEGFGNICVAREEIPTPGAMSVRDLLCAGSLVGFLLFLYPESPENSPNLIILQLF